jgi:hypothetical protein
LFVAAAGSAFFASGSTVAAACAPITGHFAISLSIEADEADEAGVAVGACGVATALEPSCDFAVVATAVSCFVAEQAPRPAISTSAAAASAPRRRVVPVF